MGLRPGLLACAILTVAVAARAERLPIRTYTNLDGLAHVRVTCVLSDSRGFVWFCSPDGLSRFDGQGFTTYGVPDGMATARINHFIETADGAYLVATNGAGVYRFNPQNRGRLVQRASSRLPPQLESRFQSIPVGDNPQTNRVNVLHQDGSGRLWAGTDGGLFCFDNRLDPPGFRRVDLQIPGLPEPAVQVWAIADDRSGRLWVGTSAGLAGRLPDGRMVHSAVVPSAGADHVRALLVDRENRLWLGHDNGVVVFRPFHASGSRLVIPRPRLPASHGLIEDSWVSTANGLSPGVVRAFRQSADGDIWIGTLGGVTRFDGQRFHAFTQADGVGRAQALAEDGDGNIWIGTLTSGAQRLVPDGFLTYTETDGLTETVIRTIFEDSAGQLHAVSQNQQIHRFDGVRFTSVRPNLWRDSAAVFSAGRALQNRDGEWWVPGGAGLYRFPRVTRLEQLARVRPRLYTSRDGLAGHDSMEIFEDSRGDIWIGRRLPASLVVTRWERSTDTFHKYGEADGLPPYNRPQAFAEDGAGNVWIGFQNGGLARYRQGRFNLFTSAEGAPRGGIAGLHVDRRGRLWIGGHGPALTYVDAPAAEQPLIQPYTRTTALSGDSVGCITEDRAGRLYLCTTRGPLDRLDPDSGDVRRFTTADGLISADLSIGYRDRFGDIWFAAYNGVLRLVPAADRPKRAPAVRIAAVRVAGEAYLTSDLGEREVQPFRLNSNQNRLRIEFFGLGAGPDTGLRYQYRLEGSDNSWNPPTDRRDVDYGSLAPGRYRFLVRALGPDGAVSREAASVEFTILRPTWQRWWFQTGIVASIMLLALAAHRVRVRQLVALEQVRMRIASDLHDDIGGSLSRIAIQSEVARREATRLGEQPVRRLSDIAESARLVVDALGDVVWSVDPRRDDLASVFRRLRGYADDVITGSGVRWTFKASGDFEEIGLTPQARRHLYLLFKEALTNIARHASATTATMAASLIGHELRVDLHDDGRGFALAEGADGEARSHGLSSMRLRAAQLRGRLTIDSARDAGTRLVFVMPVPVTWRRLSRLVRPRLRWRRMRSRS